MILGVVVTGAIAVMIVALIGRRVSRATRPRRSMLPARYVQQLPDAKRLNARAVAGAFAMMGGALAMIGGLISLGFAYARLPIIVAPAQSTGPPAAAMPTASQSEMPPPYRRHGATFIESLKTLNLSESQDSQIHAILVDPSYTEQSVRGSGIQANNADAHTNIETILTPAQ
jgi:hypothetical protein